MNFGRATSGGLIAHSTEPVEVEPEPAPEVEAAPEPEPLPAEASVGDLVNWSTGVVGWVVSTTAAWLEPGEIHVGADVRQRGAIGHESRMVTATDLVAASRAATGETVFTYTGPLKPPTAKPS